VNITYRSAHAFYLIMLIALGLTLVSSFWEIIPKKSFALEALQIGVYWDYSCTSQVFSIGWGQLTPGSNREVVIFVRNDNLNKPCFIFMWTREWIPNQADKFVFLSWDYEGQGIEPKKVIPVNLNLRIAKGIRGFTDFSYTMVILGSDDPLPWDVTNDRYVGTNDIVTLVQAFGSQSSGSNWNSDFDVTFDGHIGVDDIVLVAQHFGESI
jgi:hypothetical protein